MAERYFATHSEAIQARCFSRRHQTQEAHQEARKRPSFKNPASRVIRRERALARQKETENMSPAARLIILDATLGKGKGAQRERARLQKKLNQKEGK